MYCRHCGSTVDPNAYVCVQCGVKTGTGYHYCPNCGSPTGPQAAVCVNCGISLAPPVVAPPADAKSKLAAGLLAIFLGALGVHNFYLGYTTKAVVQLLLTVVGSVLTCGISALVVEIWAFVEGILLLTGSINQDGRGMPLRG